MLANVHTPMSQNWTQAQKLWKERSPMKRGTDPSDIAHTASLLVASRYLTEEVIMLDGGLNLT